MLNQPISAINKYCKQLHKKLEKLNLFTIEDLLFYCPTRYEDYSNIKKINELKINDIATIKVKVKSLRNYNTPKQNKKITDVVFYDETDTICATWFNQWFLNKIMMPETEFFLIAKVGYNKKELINPEYEKINTNPTHTARIIPIYPLTYGISQKQIRTVIKAALNYVEYLKERLPEEIIKNNKLIEIKKAVQNIHFPSSEEIRLKSLQRLAFDELFLINLKNFWLKKGRENSKATKIIFKEKETKIFVDSLPFKLTDAQRKASWEILQDIKNPYPMNRMLNGDVGSGKTLVSAIAIYNTFLSNLQSALLSPTEILATQHYNSFYNWFNKYEINIALLTRNFSLFNNEKITKTALLEKIKNGEANIIIGTHAIIQEKIKFKKLSLVIIDEQHRFGVEQRGRLSSLTNKISPHLLSMTATPIPRTLALIMYGDLNISILDEMPKGRTLIKTSVVNAEKRLTFYNFIKKEIEAGRQAFVICPLIDESDKLGVKSVTNEYKKLNEIIFPNFKIAMLHGKLKAKEKEEIMQKFKNNKINILVSTSVIEVGIDIPNATIMMIEGAERFGLAQLHQFRGRVGRGAHQSYCFIFPTEHSTERLNAMERILDGFKLAEIDLKLRGPGNMYGKEQSGKLNFKLADINDTFLIKNTRDCANNIIKKDPELTGYPYLKKYLSRELQNIHLE